MFVVFCRCLDGPSDSRSDSCDGKWSCQSGRSKVHGQDALAAPALDNVAAVPAQPSRCFVGHRLLHRADADLRYALCLRRARTRPAQSPALGRHAGANHVLGGPTTPRSHACGVQPRYLFRRQQRHLRPRPCSAASITPTAESPPDSRQAMRLLTRADRQTTRHRHVLQNSALRCVPLCVPNTTASHVTDPPQSASLTISAGRSSLLHHLDVVSR